MKVRVIARSTLNSFVSNRVEPRERRSIKSHLDSWYAEVSRAAWVSSAELKSQFRSASIVSAERVVFNIKGNDYRLVVSINYQYQVLLIKWLGTHEEYDRLDVMKVDCDEGRYGNPTNKN